MDKKHFLSVIASTLQIAFLPGVLSKCDYMGEDLLEVPSGISNDCSDVDVSSNEITQLPTAVFNSLTQCTELYLGGNRISEIEYGSH